jgi:hypothetical protein
MGETMGKSKFWSKTPQERTQIVAERLRKRMDDYHVTELFYSHSDVISLKMV